MKKTESQIQIDIGTWLLEGDVGSSSKSLCAIYLGSQSNNISYPLDYGDFNRCMEFLKLLNPNDIVWVLGIAAERDKTWAGIKENWAEFDKWYSEDNEDEIYKKLKAVRYQKENEIIIET